MTKSFKTDAERNSYFTLLANTTNTPDNIKSVNGLLYKDNVLVTDQKFITSMETMFDSMEKLAALNGVA